MTNSRIIARHGSAQGTVIVATGLPSLTIKGQPGRIGMRLARELHELLPKARVEVNFVHAPANEDDAYRAAHMMLNSAFTDMH